MLYGGAEDLMLRGGAENPILYGGAEDLMLRVVQKISYSMDVLKISLD